ncbi:hypothetical protein BY996DRAFT_6520284 [Phakopsora pachyrhizi]|nr:hypothetical protein BY996DRAFT_6520284 [Phakopsora pachyrhizi]
MQAVKLWVWEKAERVRECPESVKQNCPADRILDRSLKVCQSEPLLVGDWRMLLKQDDKALICIKEWSRYWIGWTGADLFKKSQSQVRMMSYESIKGEETDKEEDNYEGIIEETDTCFEERILRKDSQNRLGLEISNSSFILPIILCDVFNAIFIKKSRFWIL